MSIGIEQIQSVRCRMKCEEITDQLRIHDNLSVFKYETNSIVLFALFHYFLISFRGMLNYGKMSE